MKEGTKNSNHYKNIHVSFVPPEAREEFLQKLANNQDTKNLFKNIFTLKTRSHIVFRELDPKDQSKAHQLLNEHVKIYPKTEINLLEPNSEEIENLKQNLKQGILNDRFLNSTLYGKNYLKGI